MPGAPKRTSWPSPSTLGPRRSACDWAPPRLCVEIAFPKNPYKTRTKADHFCECEFFIPVISTTYNFSVIKCTDSNVGTSLRRRPLPSIKTRQNGTNFNSQRIQPLRPRYLRRSSCRPSHFGIFALCCVLCRHAVPYPSQPGENRNFPEFRLSSLAPRRSTHQWCFFGAWGLGVWCLAFPQKPCHRPPL